MSKDTQLRIRRATPDEQRRVKICCSRCGEYFQYAAERPGLRLYYWCRNCDTAVPRGRT